ncbi:uncharacterized protein [Trachinotus anak]|uniref:uncharacterized protein n=1 Tax=Trachinotus anak TaxID=443729 RepID=UPI0039F1903F
MWLQRFAFILLCSGFAVQGGYIEVSVGDPVRFPETRTCATENAELSHHLAGDRDQLVARYQDGVWKPGPGYQDRMGPGTSVTLNTTYITDKGLYHLTCEKTPTQLDVVPFYEAEAAERKPATVHCYYGTAGRHVESVRWERDGKHVFEIKFSSNETTLGAGFEGRVSLPPESNKTGNFSLIFQWVLPEDRGDYRCYIQADGEKERGNPAAARLRVKEESPGQTTTAPQPASTTQKGPGDTGMGPWPIVIAVTVIVAALGTGFGWWLKSCCSNVPTSASSDEEHELEQPLNGAPPPLPHLPPGVNGRPPVNTPV